MQLTKGCARAAFQNNETACKEGEDFLKSALWLTKASPGDLEHNGAGWAGLFGRVAGIGDTLAG